MRPIAANAALRPFHISARSASSLGHADLDARRALGAGCALARAVMLDLGGGPSTSISSSAASASSGQSTCDRGIAASIASRSIISIAAGTMPRAMIARDRVAGLVGGAERREQRVRRLGRRQDRAARTSVTIAERALRCRPARRAGRSRARPAPAAAELDDRAVRRHHVGAEHVVDVKPYFRQCAPPEFSATLPPMVQTLCEDGSGA